MISQPYATILPSKACQGPVQLALDNRFNTVAPAGRSASHNFDLLRITQGPYREEIRFNEVGLLSPVNGAQPISTFFRSDSAGYVIPHEFNYGQPIIAYLRRYATKMASDFKMMACQSGCPPMTIAGT